MSAPTRPPRSAALLIAAPDLDPRDALNTASAMVHSVHSVQALVCQAASDNDLGDPGQPSGGLWSSVSLLETVATLLEGATGALERAR
jgi:hypothetical protein